MLIGWVRHRVWWAPQATAWIVVRAWVCSEVGVIGWGDRVGYEVGVIGWGDRVC